MKSSLPFSVVGVRICVQLLLLWLIVNAFNIMYGSLLFAVVVQLVPRMCVVWVSIFESISRPMSSFCGAEALQLHLTAVVLEN